MWKQSTAMLALLAIGGCASNDTGDGARMTVVEPSRTELAAAAARAQYPATMPAKEAHHAFALVNSGKGYIKIYNMGAEPITDAKVWVNGAFMQHVSGIGPKSSAIVRFADLYNSLGKNFNSLGEPVSQVQIETNGQLLTLQGPASD